MGDLLLADQILRAFFAKKVFCKKSCKFFASFLQVFCKFFASFLQNATSLQVDRRCYAAQLQQYCKNSATRTTILEDTIIMATIASSLQLQHCCLLYLLISFIAKDKF